jgi:Fic family protein
VTERDWAAGPDRYLERIADRSGIDSSRAESAGLPTIVDEQLALAGISWGDIDYSPIRFTSMVRALQRFRGRLPELIWNTAALEGNAFTLPEVRTLLDGVTVGGKRTDDERQILALSEAYSELDDLVGREEFTLTKGVSDDLHRALAIHEAVESGHFRGEGVVTGGGSVRLSNGGSVAGIDPGAGGSQLIELHRNLVGYLVTLSDPRERALLYNAAATHYQFYFDGNKRTARLMMTGELMSNGYEAVNVPFARKLEYNLALDTLFETADATELLTFLVSCADPADS